MLQTGNGRRAMFRSVEDSLRRLDTDYIDLLYVHFPDFVTPVEEIVRAFDDLARAGKILYAGLSNFPAWMTARGVTLAELRGWTPISAVQFEYSLVERSGDRDNLPDGRGARRRRRAVVAAGRRTADRQVPQQQRGQADRVESVGARRGRAGEGRDGGRRARRRRASSACRPAGWPWRGCWNAPGGHRRAWCR